jgi:glucose-6-phosphate 1-dehydrogenase
MSLPASDYLVIFGITGDLAKKMTFPSLYNLEKRGLLNTPILGVAFPEWTLEQLGDYAHESIDTASATYMAISRTQLFMPR